MESTETRLVDLPSELILDIASDLSIRDVNSLGLTTKRFHALLSSTLYSLGAAAGGDTTPLIWAVENGHDSIVARLLEKGADPGYPTPTTSAFHVAIARSNTTALKLLLQTGVSPYVLDQKLLTPLKLTVRFHRLDMLDMFLDAGIYPDDNDDWAETLKTAVSSCNKQATRRLLEAGAKTTPYPARRALDDTMLAAARTGKRAMVKLLVKFGWDNWGTVRLHDTTPLHVACEKGHAPLVEFMLECGADINANDELGYTPLHRAVFGTHAKVVDLILQAGPDINAGNVDDGKTALHTAVENGPRRIIKALLKAGADVNVTSTERYTPLHYAVRTQTVSVIKLMLEYGADITATTSRNRTPLYMASCEGNVEVVKFLLDRGAHISEPKSGGMTPLYAASGRGHSSIIQPLVDAGFEVKSANSSPLFDAARFNHSETMRELIRYGADVNYMAPPPSETSILKRAVQATGPDALKVLIAAGVDLNSPNGRGGILEYAVAITAIVENIQLLLDHGVLVNAVIAPSKRTALHSAVQRHHMYAIPLLLNAGISINAQDYQGRTALHYAAERDYDVVEALLTGGGVNINVNARRDDGLTPLHISAGLDKRTENLLINAGADVMAKDNVGRTPLHIAAAESNKVFFKQQFNWCQQKGFDYLAQSTYGWSVVEEAASGGCVPILQMLASGGVEVISNNLQAHGQHRGTPALHLAAIYSHLSCVNYLMSHGADPLYLDVYGRTAMDWANLYAHDKVFSLLHRHNFCYAPTDAATRASILKESVVGLAKRMLSGDRADFYKLGKCLQYLDNIPAAATAYSLGQIKCRDCDFAISHTEASFACRRCSDIHLCSECMNEFIVGDNIFRTYCQHDDCERFILGEHALPEQAGGESAALEAAWARWFTELIATYSQ